MSGWLLGIVGIICLGLLLEIVLPEGQTTKYVRGAFSLLVIFVVIAPLPKIFGGDIDLAFDDIGYDVDENFVHSVSMKYTDTLEENIEIILKESGYNSTVEIVVEEGSVREIDLVVVKIFFSVINENEMNTHIQKVKAIVSKHLSLKDDVVLVNYGSD